MVPLISLGFWMLNLWRVWFLFSLCLLKLHLLASVLLGFLHFSPLVLLSKPLSWSLSLQFYQYTWVLQQKRILEEMKCSNKQIHASWFIVNFCSSYFLEVLHKNWFQGAITSIFCSASLGLLGCYHLLIDFKIQ